MAIVGVKQGMKVRRTKFSHNDMSPGDVDVVVSYNPGDNSMNLEKWGRGHDARNFEAYIDVLAPPKEVLQPILDSVAHITGSDPNGLSQHSPGAKLDAGKPMLWLVLSQGFPNALRAVGEVGTFGAKKYTPCGWLTVPNGIGRYSDAMMRHLLAEGGGETLDPESKLAHAAHAAWNALARLELMMRDVPNADTV